MKISYTVWLLTQITWFHHHILYAIRTYLDLRGEHALNDDAPWWRSYAKDLVQRQRQILAVWVQQTWTHNDLGLEHGELALHA